MTSKAQPAFSLIGAGAIGSWLERNHQTVYDVVKATYLQQAGGVAINPDSYFLRFPENTRDRIMALPATIESDTPVAGIKWIASFPQNVGRGLDRASAVIIVNDRVTGYPVACMEGSMISAARTAAAAVIGAEYLHGGKRIACLGVVGCGLIAKATIDFLYALGWRIDSVMLFDQSSERAALLASKYTARDARFSIAADLEELTRGSDMILFATSANIPFVENGEWFGHAPTVLHMSLRDLSVNIIAGAQNVADDVEHCLKGQTSLHLAFLARQDKSFIDGGVAGLINGTIVPDMRRTRVFSPFGMGVLDLAVAQRILAEEGLSTVFDDFFPTPYVAA